MIKLSKIKLHPDNPRLIKDERFEKLVKSISEFPKMLKIRPIIVDKDNVILAGNMRYKALKHLKFKEIPEEWVKCADELTEEEKKRFIIADNVGFGQWDWDMLANDWDEKELMDWGLEIPDFDDVEELEAVEDDYSEPEQMKVDVVEGDLIEFVCDDGRVHRLICGDSTDSDAVAKLMDGKKADMVFTDPPYGVSFQSGARKEKFDILKNDDKFLTEWVPNINLFSKGFVFVWCSWHVVADWVDITSVIGKMTNTVIWAKRASGMGDLYKTFATDFEIALVFNRGEKLKAKRCGSVWDIMRDDVNSYLHPTQKPVELPSKAISLTTVKNNIILDFFLGSGSTLVAAHQLKRTCFGMELDTKYCQVIIDRMQKLDNTLTVKINGKEYKKEAENVPF